MTALSLVPAAAPTLTEEVVALVARLRAQGLRAIAAAHRDQQYAAVIIPARCCRPGGQYEAHPLPGGGYRIRWHRTESRIVPVDDTDTPENAAGMILDHLAGLYP